MDGKKSKNGGGVKKRNKKERDDSEKGRGKDVINQQMY